MKKRLFVVLAIVFTFVFMVSGCTGTKEDTADTTADNETPETVQATAQVDQTSEDLEETVKKGGALKYGLSSEPATLEPAKAIGTVQRVLKEAMYRGLLGFDADGNKTYELAESIDIASDNLSYTVKLRDANFHNGDPVTAEDVAYSFNRILDPNTGASFSQELSVIESIDTPDEKTVVF